MLTPLFRFKPVWKWYENASFRQHYLQCIFRSATKFDTQIAALPTRAYQLGIHPI
jgi:hypothetical protein